LTEWLRGRSDDQLGRLLARRPDLALPAPADIATLASRLSVRSSVQRAIDGLDAFTLRVVEALVLAATSAGVVVASSVAPLLERSAAVGVVDGALDAAIRAALAEIRELALVWGEDDELHLAAPVRDVIGPYPAGLGRPLAELSRYRPITLDSDAAIRRALDETSEVERDILYRLMAGPPVGIVRDAQRSDSAGDQSPARRLIARGLLVAIDAQTVELPREVGRLLRSEAASTSATVPVTAPVIEASSRPPAELDQVGTTAVLETLRLVAGLGQTWTAKPPAALRAGGIGIRDLRRTARDLGVEESAAAVVIEVAYAAGLIGPTNGINPVYLPTVDFDVWLRLDPAPRWTQLASAWLGMTRQPSLVSQRGERDRLLNALGPDVERGTSPALRAQVLDGLTSLPPGATPVDRAVVLARLAWEAPRRAPAQRAITTAILDEADQLGVTAAGGLTGYSRTLLDGSRAVAEQVLTSALPEPVDHFVVQPDLTVVVPGPPTPALAEELALVADLESTGGASVYRITEASVRRALDADRTAADIAALMTEHSRTPIPQALSYLIEDAARRHGILRAGTASAYLRCDDEALLARVVADRGTAALGLRRLAPTVAICTAPVPRVLDVLREAGYAPAGESPDGGIVTLTDEVPRAPSRPPGRSVRVRAAGASGVHQAELVRRIRTGDSLTTLSHRVAPIAQEIPGVTSATTMGLLREAIRESRRVWLGYANADGTASRHTILPISMAGGMVRGHDAQSQRLQSFALHRITAVNLVGDDDDV
jgi:hypothetical protein